MDRKKTSVLATLKVLQKYSDKHHILSLKEIVDHLEKEYDVKADRRTLYDNFEVLKDFGFCIDGYRAGHCGYNLVRQGPSVKQLSKLYGVLKENEALNARDIKQIKATLEENLSVHEVGSLK